MKSSDLVPLPAYDHVFVCENKLLGSCKQKDRTDIKAAEIFLDENRRL